VTSALFYTTEEVARILRMKERTVQSLAEEEKIPGAVRLGRQWRFDRDALQRYVGRQLPEPEREDAQA
jgi:excisionase family DNA binding protein